MRIGLMMGASRAIGDDLPGILAFTQQAPVDCQGGAVSAAVAQSMLTCPSCGHSKTETMPTDACQFFYECERCHAVLRPKPSDCCVYCSYGSVPCPPVQQRAKRCG